MRVRERARARCLMNIKHARAWHAWARAHTCICSASHSLAYGGGEAVRRLAQQRAEPGQRLRHLLRVRQQQRRPACYQLHRVQAAAAKAARDELANAVDLHRAGGGGWEKGGRVCL